MSEVIKFPIPTPNSPYLLSAKNIDQIIFTTLDNEECFIEDPADVATIMSMIIRSKMKVFRQREYD